jgi:hypothetical protein
MSTKKTLTIVFVFASIAAGCGASQGRAKTEEGWNDCSAGECTNAADELEVVMTPPAGTAQPAIDPSHGGVPRKVR